MGKDSERAFVAIQIGDKGSPERRRADDICEYVIRPVLEKFHLSMIRADRDPTPGQITPQMVRSLLESRVVIADLTNRNANVYYEVAVAHSFGRPVVCLVDAAKSVAFDIKDERLIELGEHGEALSASQAEEAKKRLESFLEVVLSDDFKPTSVVVEVAAARSIDQLAPENPIAAELAAIRELIEGLHQIVRPRRVIPAGFREERKLLMELVEDWAKRFEVDEEEVRSLVTDHTSPTFDEWVEAVSSTLASTRRHEEEEPPF